MDRTTQTAPENVFRGVLKIHCIFLLLVIACGSEEPTGNFTPRLSEIRGLMTARLSDAWSSWSAWSSDSEYGNEPEERDGDAPCSWLLLQLLPTIESGINNRRCPVLSIDSASVNGLDMDIISTGGNITIHSGCTIHDCDISEMYNEKEVVECRPSVFLFRNSQFGTTDSIEVRITEGIQEAVIRRELLVGTPKAQFIGMDDTTSLAPGDIGRLQIIPETDARDSVLMFIAQDEALFIMRSWFENGELHFEVPPDADLRGHASLSGYIQIHISNWVPNQTTRCDFVECDVRLEACLNDDFAYVPLTISK